MADEQAKSLGEFDASFKGFLDQMAAQAPAEDPVFLKLLRQHFSADPTAFPVVAEQFEPSEHPNVQKAMDAYVCERGRSAELIGVTGDQAFTYSSVGISQLIATGRSGMWGGSAIQGPIQYVNIAVGDERVLPCVQCGLYLINDDARRVAVLIRGPSEMGITRKITVEAMAPDRPAAEEFLGELRNLIRKQNVYRSRVISLVGDRHEGVKVHFHRLPPIGRDQIILPEGLLARVERQPAALDRDSRGR